MTPLPLERYELFHSRDLDQAREIVGRIFTPHRLDLLGREKRLDARMHSRRFRDIAVNYITYGGDVRIDPGPLETFFVVQIPLSGRAEIRCGNEQVESKPGLASVVSPTEPLTMRWSSDCAQLIVRIERTALEARLSDMLGVSLRRPLRFKPAMDVESRYGQSWRLAVETLVADIDRPGSLIEHPLVAQQAEQLLMTGLLVAHPSNYSSVIEGESRAASSRAVSIALEWIESHPKYEHTTASLARAAGVTERALQLGFRKHLNMRPMEYLREVRLQRVRDQLLVSQPDAVTVAEVAAEWGFLHTGHFAARYQQRFKEKPSQTLRR